MAYHPQEMEAAIFLARGLEDTAATHLVAPPAAVLVHQHQQEIKVEEETEPNSK